MYTMIISSVDTQLTEEEIDAVQKLFCENNVEAPTGLVSLSFEKVTKTLRAQKRDDLADNLRTKLDEGMYMQLHELKRTIILHACSVHVYTIDSIALIPEHIDNDSV